MSKLCYNRILKSIREQPKRRLAAKYLMVTYQFLAKSMVETLSEFTSLKEMLITDYLSVKLTKNSNDKIC